MNKLAGTSPNTSSRPLLYTIIILSFSILGCGKYLRQENSNGVPSIHCIQNLIRIPLTRQAADYTCGVAALQSILYYYGQEFLEDDLMEKLGPTPEMVIWKDPPGKVYNPGEVKRMR